MAKRATGGGEAAQAVASGDAVNDRDTRHGGESVAGIVVRLAINDRNPAR